MTLAEIFFLNTMTEIEWFQTETANSTDPKPKIPSHCTDVYASGKTHATCVWGHNEDSGPHDANVSYIVDATISVNGTVVERFVAYTYAASVAGRAFGWNHNNLIITTNALFSNSNAFDNSLAIPRAFHNRAMYAATSVEEAIFFATAVPTITAFSLNIGTWPASQQLAVDGYNAPFAPYHNIETCPSGAFSVTPIYLRPNESNWAPSSLKSTQFHFYHANNYEVLRGNATIDVDSTARINRLNEFPIPTTSRDVRDMLGDTFNASWPVWQHGCEDGLYTLATAIFHLEGGYVELFADNPKTTNQSLRFAKL